MKVSWEYYEYYAQYMEKSKNVPNHHPDHSITTSRKTPWIQTIGFLHPSAQLSRCRRGPAAPNAEKKHMRQHPGLNLALGIRGSSK